MYICCTITNYEGRPQANFHDYSFLRRGFMKKVITFVVFLSGLLISSISTANCGHYIGEYYQGGVIFYLDQTGSHGLIAAIDDSSVNGGQIKWSENLRKINVGINRNGIGAGEVNTKAIISTQGPGKYAASVAASTRDGGYDDWYLPSLSELKLMFARRSVIGGFNVEECGYYGRLCDYNLYWSSNHSTFDMSYAFVQSFSSDNAVDANLHARLKDTTARVRPIRHF